MIRLVVNSRLEELDVDPATPLLWVLRDQLGLTGTKYGCGIGQCGSCTVHLDGAPVRACLVSAENVDGRAVTTIEGLNSVEGRAVQEAWLSLQVPQCGFCQSGQIMSASSLLSRSPMPTNAQIDDAMHGNICRCSTYQRIKAAINLAAQSVSDKKGAQDAEE